MGDVRVCLVTTHDDTHAKTMIKLATLGTQQHLYHFTLSGCSYWNPDRICWETIGGNNSDFTELLRRAEELRGGAVIILDDGIPFLRDENGDIRARDQLRTMLSAESRHLGGLVLVFVESPQAEAMLPAVLADRFVRLHVDYPRAPDLENILREELVKAFQRLKKPIDAKIIRRDSKRLSSGLVGLTCSGSRDTIRDAIALPGSYDFDNTFQHLQNRKNQQLKRELKMEVLNSIGAEHPIGLDFLMEYLSWQRQSVCQYGENRARGILLIGSPGTGKTMLAKAIGQILGLPVIEFKIGSLINSRLGETERRFAQAFATLEAMAPNVIFIDELEKAFGDSSEQDGGTMMRCTGSLLSWLSDNPHPNYIVATSNSLKRMGEIGLTMTRSGRFDKAFFVDVPSYESRQKMLERWLGDLIANPSDIATKLAGSTEKFSGADLHSLIKEASTRAEHKKISVTLDLLQTEAERKRMRVIALYDEFRELRRWGQMYCEPAGPTDK